MSQTPDPRHEQITPIRIAGDKWYDWRYPKAGDFSAAFDQTIDGPALARLLLTERWHMSAEIVPNYVPEYARPDYKPQLQVRVK